MRVRAIYNVAAVMLGGLLLLDGRPMATAADAPTPAAPAIPQRYADVFKSDGLTIVDSVLQTADEAPVHVAVNKVLVLKNKLATESSAVLDLTRAMNTQFHAYETLAGQLTSLNEQINATKDAAASNALLVQHNEVIRQLDQKRAAITELRKREARVEDYQSPYADAVAAATTAADAASDHYSKLAQDTVLGAAIENSNRTLSQPLKLGPSPQCAGDLVFLHKCSYSLALDAIPARMEQGVPIVNVTVNGLTQEMVWDSGASLVSLSNETATAMGLHASDKDPTITTTIANGREVKSRLVIAPEIRVGPFIAKDVACIVDPPSNVRSPDLLGGTFQSRFLCRVDEQAEVLHLMPLDKSVTLAPDAKPAPVRAARGPAVARQHRRVPMPAPIDGTDVFALRGLAKVGFVLEIPQETEVRAGVNAVRSLKSKVVAEALARASSTRELDTATHEYDQLLARVNFLSAKLKSLKNQPDQYNQLVDPYNQTVGQLKLKGQLMDQCQAKAKSVPDSRNVYVDAVVSAVTTANGVSDQYGALGADPAFGDLLAKSNAGAAKQWKLGPSASFTMDLAFLRKTATDMAAEGVTARVSGEVPLVQVSINGKTQEMLWDSGASGLSLSAETAAELGLRATSSDPTVHSTIADGRTFDCKLIIVPEVRVGTFIARNVECVIWPSGGARKESLLGGAFQRHFVCRLDRQAGVIHLTPVDDSAETAADARPWSSAPASEAGPETSRPPEAPPPPAAPQAIAPTDSGSGKAAWSIAPGKWSRRWTTRGGNLAPDLQNQTYEVFDGGARVKAYSWNLPFIREADGSLSIESHFFQVFTKGADGISVRQWAKRADYTAGKEPVYIGVLDPVDAGRSSAESPASPPAQTPQIPPDDGVPRRQMPAGAAKYQNHIFAAIKESCTWMEAKAKCEAMGGHLAKIDDPDGIKFVHGLKPAELWVGAADLQHIRQYVWLDGTPVDPTLWRRGEPSYGKEDAVLILSGGDGLNDVVKDSKHGFVCEWD